MTRLFLISMFLAVVWLAAAPPPILVTLGAPQTVVTRHPKMGIHTSMTDEVEAWKIKKNYEMVREMGAPYVVEFFPWAYIENQKGEFDWEHADAMVDHARQQGLTVIARLGFVPPWARPEGTSTSYLDSDRYGDFGDFAAAFAEHYKGRVEHLIIWNEPNVNFEWGQRPPGPAAYTELLNVAYTRAREKNPAVKILAGALAPNLAPPGGTSRSATRSTERSSPSRSTDSCSVADRSRPSTIARASSERKLSRLPCMTRRLPSRRTNI